MSVTIRQGSPQFPAVTGSIPASTQETMDAAVQNLQEHKDAWVALSNRERIAILDKLINDFAAIAQLWIAASLQAKGIAGDSPGVGEEWVAGVWPVLKNLRQLRNSLSDIEIYGHPRIPGPSQHVLMDRGWHKYFHKRRMTASSSRALRQKSGWSRE